MLNLCTLFVYILCMTVEESNLAAGPAHTVASSRQNWSALLEAAQTEPQVIKKHKQVVALVVSPELWVRAHARAEGTAPASFAAHWAAVRERHAPEDNRGLADTVKRRSADSKRANPFASAR
jgi:hypothetical protein